MTIWLCLVVPAAAEPLEDPEEFLHFAEAEFQGLLLKAPEDRARHWKSQSFLATMEYSSELENLAGLQEELKKDIPGYREVSPFAYREKYLSLRLGSAVSLVEGLGKELVDIAIGERLEPLLQELERSIFPLRRNTGNPAFDAIVNNFYRLKGDIESFQKGIEEKATLSFRPKASAWDDSPDLVAVYVIHDWGVGLSKVDRLENELAELATELAAFSFLSPKDPFPFVTVAVQLAVLLVVVAGCLVTYSRNPSIRFLVVLVLSSMVLSLVLVFLSPETSLNLVVQSFVPGGFIVYWIMKNRKTEGG